MREIKFRAWHEGNKAFIYATLKSIWMNGWTCCEALGSPKLPKEKDGIFSTQESLENFPAFEPNAEWEQFIGRCDKNGKEIYEGDIIILTHWFIPFSNQYPERWLTNSPETVKLPEFYSYILNDKERAKDKRNKYEIIGTIHDAEAEDG